MKIKNNLELLEEVGNGSRTAYAWGIGDIFETHYPMHKIPLQGIIHTAAEMQGTKRYELNVMAPDALHEMNPDNSLIVGYSSAYRDEILQYCKTLGIPVIFYDAPELPTRKLKYDFWGDFVNDVGRALTRHVYFIHLENLHGDIAEFGTYSGNSARVLAEAMSDAPYAQGPGAMGLRAPPRNLHLFDSFQGLPPVMHDLDVRAGWLAGSFRDKTEAELTKIVSQHLPLNQVRVYPGWFKDTMKSIPATQKFSLVHVDCDLYESTIDVLDYLFAHDHCADGCAIFFDDWNCGQFNPDLGERRAWREVVEKYKIQYTDCGNYSAYGNKFIVHTKRYG